MTIENEPEISETKNPNDFWHPAYYEAIKMELEEYADVLHYDIEFNLNKAPFKIDLVIIKKEPDVVIEKHIAALFRTRNILEFKGPDDYLSIDDFYHVYGCACLYSSSSGKDDKVPITDLTISLIAAENPKKLMQHLKECGSQIQEKWSGIYYVTGNNIIPIQIIVISQLAEGETHWLKALNKHQTVENILRIIRENSCREGDPRYKLFLQTIAISNMQAFREALKMGYPTFQEVLEGTDIPKIWMAEGRAEEAREVITRALEKAIPVETIAYLTGVDTEAIERYQRELHP